jgi:hypothetical protein
VNSEATTGTEETERWNRIATLAQGACAIVARDGKDVLIKFDGGRDNGDIYTVVLDVAREGAVRVDSDDLEKALSHVLGPDIEGVTLLGEDLAGTLRRFDLLARRGFIINIRILQDGERLSFEVFLSRLGRTFTTVLQQGPVLQDVAAEIVRQAERTS